MQSPTANRVVALDNRGDGDERGRAFGALGAAYAFAFQLAGGLLIGYYGGSYLDELLGTGPWLAVVATTLGAVAAFRALIRQLRKRSG